MRVIRVFPRKTSLTPKDGYAFVGDPPMIRPVADEVHVSCTFTWDMAEAERLAKAWGQYYEIVKIGGPAYASPLVDFMPGKYIIPGVTFTSYGCNNQCPWCLVRRESPKLFELYDFKPGNIIQDNNLLQCNRHHIERVIEMLRYQGRAAVFSGGMESKRVTDWFVDELKTLTIRQIFLAADTRESIKPLRKATSMIGLPRDKVRCYVLLKFNPDESISEATGRLEEVWQVGAMPFAQLYQPPDKYITYPQEWRDLARTWSRPAAMKSLMKSGALL